MRCLKYSIRFSYRDGLNRLKRVQITPAGRLQIDPPKRTIISFQPVISASKTGSRFPPASPREHSTWQNAPALSRLELCWTVCVERNRKLVPMAHKHCRMPLPWVQSSKTGTRFLITPSLSLHMAIKRCHGPVSATFYAKSKPDYPLSAQCFCSQKHMHHGELPRTQKFSKSFSLWHWLVQTNSNEVSC